LVIKKAGCYTNENYTLPNIRLESLNTPLGFVGLPFPKKFQHHIDDHEYLGSMEMEEEYYDFYKCPLKYITRNGNGEQDCDFFSLEYLQTVVDSRWHVDILRTILTIDEAGFKNLELGFAVIPNESDIQILVNPLLDPRRRIYIEDAIPIVYDKFLYTIISPDTIINIVSYLSQLVMYQIKIGR
jgi:hypothetical protein